MFTPGVPPAPPAAVEVPTGVVPEPPPFASSVPEALHHESLPLMPGEPSEKLTGVPAVRLKLARRDQPAPIPPVAAFPDAPAPQISMMAVTVERGTYTPVPVPMMTSVVIGLQLFQ
jgi:hypothetical protein